MLLGILSDTHGNLEAIQEVASRFLAAQVDLVLHLGDDYLDILFLRLPISRFRRSRVCTVPNIEIRPFRIDASKTWRESAF